MSDNLFSEKCIEYVNIMYRREKLHEELAILDKQQKQLYSQLSPYLSQAGKRIMIPVDSHVSAILCLDGSIYFVQDLDAASQKVMMEKFDDNKN